MLAHATLIDTTMQSLTIAASISLPLLGVALISGLVVGLLQALTSIQEMTLTFVPKLGAIMVAFFFFAEDMANSLVVLFQRDLVPLIVGG